MRREQVRPARGFEPARGTQASRWNGYFQSVGGINVSVSVCELIQRIRFRIEPALSFVPIAPAPPNGCFPTIARGRS
jgi:hypothetical protein